jgi:hypothetical protein
VFAPLLQLFAPTRITGGRAFTLRPHVHCERPTSIAAIDLYVTCRLLYGPDAFSSGGYGGHILWSNRAHLTGRRKLSTGTHAFAANFELPVNPPPTYLGSAFSIAWQAELFVRRRWWFDTTRTFGLNVEPDPSQLRAPPPSQGVWSSRPAGPLPRQPHAEISLGSTTLVPGGVLQGALALSNTHFNQYRQLEIRLVAIEHGAVVVGRVVKRWHLPLDRPGENEPLPFYFRLPDVLRPAFRFRTVSVRWQLEFVVDVAWKSDPTLAIPVAILPREFTPEDASREAPLAVGTDRLAMVWRRTAEQTGFRHEGARLVRDYDDIVAELRLEDRRRRGQVVVGEVRYADLCVGLTWDTNRGLQTDDPELTRQLDKELRPRLQQTEPNLVDDRMIAIEWRDISRSVDPLVAACSAVEGLASAMQRLIRELPPPADIDELELARWRGEARGLNARFHPSAMRIAGAAEGRRFRLATRWDTASSGARERIGLEVVLEPSRDDPQGVRETFELDAFDDALAALHRALAEASPARSLYR